MDDMQLGWTYDNLRLTAPTVELDLGCGAGSFARALAHRYPDRLILAGDVMIGRLRKVNKNREAPNLRVLRVESRYLVSVLLADASLDRIHLLCPDPWPKGKHKGHRLLASNFIAQLHRVLKTDGVFHFSTDDAPYWEQAQQVLSASGLFAAAPEALADIADLQTDFERHWLAGGKTVRHAAWRKLPLPPHTIGH